MAGDDGQLLGLVVADQHPVLAQGRLVFGGEVNDPIHPRQLFQQGAAYGLGLGSRLLLQRPDLGFELCLIEQPELIRRHPLAAWAEALALEQRNGVEAFLDALVALGQDLLHFAQATLPPQDLGVQFDGVARACSGGHLHGRYSSARIPFPIRKISGIM